VAAEYDPDGAGRHLANPRSGATDAERRLFPGLEPRLAPAAGDENADRVGVGHHRRAGLRDG